MGEVKREKVRQRSSLKLAWKTHTNRDGKTTKAKKMFTLQDKNGIRIK